MHFATQWQIALSTDPSFTSPVVDLLTVTALTLAALTGLTVSTSYLIRARHQDDQGDFSGWGPATPFTTLAANTVVAPGGFTVATQGCGGC